jgi:hypothetical protein
MWLGGRNGLVNVKLRLTMLIWRGTQQQQYAPKSVLQKSSVQGLTGMKITTLENETRWWVAVRWGAAVLLGSES